MTLQELAEDFALDLADDAGATTCPCGGHRLGIKLIAARQPELAARLGDFHISFSIAGRVHSHTVKYTTLNAAYADMDRLVEEAEAAAATGPIKGRGLAYNCAVRKIERLDPEVRAQLAIAHGDGAARRASGW
jgi:hypothetical protein